MHDLATRAWWQWGALSVAVLGTACGGRDATRQASDAGNDVGTGGAGGSARADGSTGSSAAGAGGTAGGGAGGIGLIGAGGGFPVTDAALPPSDRVDLLFMIDNSSSMADKQAILANVIGDLVRRFITPACVDPATGLVVGDRLANGGCAIGQPDFNPVTDLHIGVISSSLGSHGAANADGQEVCPDPDPFKVNAHNKDMAHLLNRTLVNGMEGTSTQAARGFLAWTGSGDADASIVLPFQSMVVGVGQHGCGYEAQLEAIYRFLNDPEPYATIVLAGRSDANPGVAQPTGTDLVVLQQRADFLRPDSLVAVVAITDENDCSINDSDPQGFFALLPPVSAQQGQISQLRRGTSACDANPNDPCCLNCGTVLSPPGCLTPSQDSACMTNGGLMTRAGDPENLRCFYQKRRYGKDFLYPVERYIAGFASPKVPDRTGAPVDNPLYADLHCVNGKDPTQSPCTPAPPRDPRQVFFAGIIGVPWQDIAVDPLDLAQGYKNAAQLDNENVWAAILGDPSNASGPILASDLHMIESIAPRPNLPGPDSAPVADPINGHDWNITQAGPPNADLQYACIFDLPIPAMCDPMNPDCDCNDGTANGGGTVQDIKNPLCQDKATGAYGHKQFRAKAYPGLRELQVLKGIGDQAIVASICPANVSPAGAGRPDFGYRPAIAAIVQRLRTRLVIR